MKMDKMPVPLCIIGCHGSPGWVKLCLISLKLKIVVKKAKTGYRENSEADRSRCLRFHPPLQNTIGTITETQLSKTLSAMDRVWSMQVTKWDLQAHLQGPSWGLHITLKPILPPWGNVSGTSRRAY
mgnify:CR=1 FL=1